MRRELQGLKPGVLADCDVGVETATYKAFGGAEARGGITGEWSGWARRLSIKPVKRWWMLKGASGAKARAAGGM